MNDTGAVWRVETSVKEDFVVNCYKSSGPLQNLK